MTFDGYLVKLDGLERLLINPNPNNDIAVFEKPPLCLGFPQAVSLSKLCRDSTVACVKVLFAVEVM